MNSLIKIAIVLALAVPSFAQNISPEFEQDIRWVNVSGNGNISIEPDYATVIYEISASGKSASEAVEALTEKANSQIELIRAAGVSDDRIETQALNVNDVTRQKDDGEPEQFFEAIYEVQVRFEKPAEIAQMLSQFTEAKVENYGKINFTAELSEEEGRALYKSAYDDAAKKAGEYAEFSGLTLGAPIKITQNDYSAFLNNESSRSVNYEARSLVNGLVPFPEPMIYFGNSIDIRFQLVAESENE